MAQDELLQEHERTWHGFMKLTTLFVVHAVIILILMAIFLL